MLKRKNSDRGWRPIDVIGLIAVIAAAVIAMSLTQLRIDESRRIQPTPTVVQGVPVQLMVAPHQVQGDTASIYFSDLYSTELDLTLGDYHPITVFGETFEACAVAHTAGLTVLTVDRVDAQDKCGQHPASWN
jgi:hypothetical protein